MMNTRLKYRGLAFGFTVYTTAEIDGTSMFLGQTCSSTQPLKPPVSLPANLQFFGRRVPVTGNGQSAAPSPVGELATA